MNNEVAFVELTKINLRAIPTGSLGALQSAHCVRRKPSEQLRRRKDNKVRCWKTKAARKCSLNQVNPFQRSITCPDNFAEARNFTLGLEINYDSRALSSPLFQSSKELGALRFGEHEIADGKFANTAILKCCAVIFSGGSGLFGVDPTFANQNVWRGELPRAFRWRRASSALH